MWRATMAGRLTGHPIVGNLLTRTGKPRLAFTRVTNVIPLLLVISAPALATQVTTMEYEKCVIGANGLEDQWPIFTISLNVDTESVSIELKHDGGWFPRKATRGKYYGHRAVTKFVREPLSQSLESPVLMIDLDYSNARFKQLGMGGPIDFDEVVYSQWEYECRRLD
jgi:hypothetical protein